MTALSVTPVDNSRDLAKLRVVVGLVCIAVLVLEYAGQAGLRPTAQRFSQLGEATSYHSLLYDLVGFWLPGALLVLLGIGLRRVLGPGWLSAGALVLLTVLGMCTVTTTIWPCRAGSTVETKVIAGGEHYWPGAPIGTARVPWATDTRNVFDASAVIADFFVAHPRAGGTAVSR